MDNRPITSQQLSQEDPTDGFRSKVLAEIKRQGMDRGELAERAGIAKDRLYKFLNGRNQTITTGDSYRIAQALGHRLDDMLSPAAGPEALELIGLVQELDPETQRLALDFARMLLARKSEE